MSRSSSCGPTAAPAGTGPAPGPGNATRIAASALLRGEASLEPRLLVIEGPDAGRALRIGPCQTVGRGRGADLRLTDPAASRVHLRLSRIDGRIVAADLDSKNGLLVNDRPCRGVRALAPGDELAIGATRLRLEPGLLDQAERAVPPGAPLSRHVEAGGVRGRHSGASLLAAAAALAALAAALLAAP